MKNFKSAVIVRKEKINAGKVQQGSELSPAAIKESARKTRQSVLTKPQTHDVTTFIELE